MAEVLTSVTRIPRCERSEPMERLVAGVVQATLKEFAPVALRLDEFAVSFWELRRDGTVLRASHRGDVRLYPASVVKVFYLAAAHAWMEEGRLSDGPELRRALHDMVVDSSNDATHYVVDLLTATTGGPELAEAEMREWENKRNAVNRYFAEQGYSRINVNQKTWNDAPYGRERVFMYDRPENRNALSTESTARLLTRIARRECVSEGRSGQMLEILARDPLTEAARPADQTHAFIAPALPARSKLWSKAGWTSQTRHDAALVELPDGRRVVLVIFTVNRAREFKIVPRLAARLIVGVLEIG
jgi:hypothetical protein